jgi:hypothetical protein
MNDFLDIYSFAEKMDASFREQGYAPSRFEPHGYSYFNASWEFPSALRKPGESELDEVSLTTEIPTSYASGTSAGVSVRIFRSDQKYPMTMTDWNRTDEGARVLARKVIDYLREESNPVLKRKTPRKANP